jgi:DNA polymerase III epsilon subunit-like protein
VTQVAVIDDQGKTLLCQTFGVEMGAFQPKEVSQQALNYNGHSDFYRDYLRPFNADDFRQLQMVLSISDDVWAHNATFDSAVYEAQRQRFFDKDPGSRSLLNWQCTMELACKKLGFKGQTRMKLPQLLMESVSHDALDDARNCWKLWQKCNGLGRWDTSLEVNLDF